MPAAPASLAADMASVPVEMSRYYKRLIDDGYALPFGEAMALEAARSGERNAAGPPRRRGQRSRRGDRPGTCQQ